MLRIQRSDGGRRGNEKTHGCLRPELSAGQNGPGVRSYLGLQGDGDAITTAILKDIGRGCDSDPDNRTGPNRPSP